MNNTVVQFENVSKRYSLGKSLLLKEAILDVFRHDQTKDFWALSNVRFSIQKGETLGIIGVNGSGKSTILKLIAGVILPTKGTVTVDGKISPLIELGAGFHSELSGRENVYLNGTILGLTKKQIDRRFDTIVQFAELEEFIDTPVKHYSSGMFMRLGFSVAVHVDPEILLIDEIFAVGDSGFQKKCFKKMKEFHKRGVTIVFVSHSLETVKSFCQRVILLQHGKVIDTGKPKEIIAAYNTLLANQL